MIHRILAGDMRQSALVKRVISVGWPRIAGAFSFLKNIYLLTGSIIFLSVLYAKLYTQNQYEMYGQIAGYITFLAFLPYFIAIIYRKTVPSKTTWWVWTFLEILEWMSYVKSGASYSSSVALACATGMFLTAILSIWYGKFHCVKFEKFYLLGSIGGIVLWIVTSSAIIALLAFLTADFFAAIPTIQKAFQHGDEDLFAWILSWAGSFVALFSIKEYTFSILLYPMYNIILYGCVIIALIMYQKRQFIQMEISRKRN